MGSRAGQCSVTALVLFSNPTSVLMEVQVLIWCTCIFPALYQLPMGMVKPSDCNALMCTVQQTLILDDDIHLLQTVFR